jgi:hypothetical protein
MSGTLRRKCRGPAAAQGDWTTKVPACLSHPESPVGGKGSAAKTKKKRMFYCIYRSLSIAQDTVMFLQYHIAHRQVVLYFRLELCSD